jgi:hypothetical protein
VWFHSELTLSRWGFDSVPWALPVIDSSQSATPSFDYGGTYNDWKVAGQGIKDRVCYLLLPSRSSLLRNFQFSNTDILPPVGTYVCTALHRDRIQSSTKIPKYATPDDGYAALSFRFTLGLQEEDLE